MVNVEPVPASKSWFVFHVLLRRRHLGVVLAPVLAIAMTPALIFMFRQDVDLAPPIDREHRYQAAVGLVLQEQKLVPPRRFHQQSLRTWTKRIYLLSRPIGIGGGSILYLPNWFCESWNACRREECGWPCLKVIALRNDRKCWLPAKQSYRCPRRTKQAPIWPGC